jgi:peptide deformylase
MAVRHVLKYPADQERLRRKSSELKRLDAEAKALIRDLKETLESQPGAGLAAPQIGVFRRVALVRFGQDQGEMQPPLAILNPVVQERGPAVKSFDGCLSIPGLCTWDSMRPSWLVFTARDENWKRFTMKVEGIDATVVDHEIDHLNGVLFIDRLDSSARLFMPRVDENGEEKLVEITRTLPKL